MSTNWDELTVACQKAQQLAADQPGRYGGRYVGRVYNKAEKRDDFIILEDDDPYTVPDHVDILA